VKLVHEATAGARLLGLLLGLLALGLVALDLVGELVDEVHDEMLVLVLVERKI
jgi:hypothetical protein